MQITRFIILGILCLQALSLSAQEIEEGQLSMEREDELEERFMEFADELNRLSHASNLQIRISESNIESGTYTRILQEKINIMSTDFQSIDYRWTALTQAEQSDIAKSKYLMELMGNVQSIKQAVADTIASQQQKCQAISDFLAAEQLILSQDSTFAKLYKQAHALSMIQKLAPKLEKVKAQEQVLFARLQTSYDKSKVATETVPQLKNRAAILDEHFYKLKTLDEKIQSMEYKPFIERIKSYLLGLACVAVILVFFNMLATKLVGIKKARQMLKKQKEMLNKTNGSEYPTI